MEGHLLGCFLLIHFASAYRHLSRDVCLLQLDEGTCLEDVPRFHYDTLTQKCTQFSYSGCGGNANNFKSYEACHKTCYSIPKIPQACRLPKEGGLCFGISKRYFFNMTTMRCEEFSYGGCGGNNNNFQDRTSCMEYCRPSKSGPVICHGGLDKGTGNASFIRYFYNYTTNTCNEFEYTGRGGNSNNFLSMKSCMSVCEKPKRSLRTRGQATRMFRKRIE
ncbi:hypothetical protein KOW79_019451 [Hemibagrus wyckioides]|uniref:BPTI/Kunitz inhibitor domain-containing protein n=1 Tax=Hemibagrus wyckioides TaxID=337641 RepID=A0A9D3N6B2_9TELE|nr:tissue factor pathway inhibitor 2 [Hemibagrus wyckioides]KAG7317153.1 hypothetical protein KOW79_019451 [Hemibagrus wyckioides]